MGQTSLGQFPVTTSVNPATDYIVTLKYNGTSYDDTRLSVSALSSLLSTYTLTAGTVTTLAYNAPATVTISGVTPNQTLNLGIPQGAPGAGSGNITTTGTVTSGAPLVFSGPLIGGNALATSSSVTGTGAIVQATGPTLTNPIVGTQTAGDNSTKAASTAFVAASFLTTASATATYLPISTASATYAPLASPALTGTPTAPTPTAGDNTTKISTTAFVQAALAAFSSAGYPVTGTSAKSSAYTLGSTGGDTGKIFLLTGSFALTVPLASGGTPTSPLYYHYFKRDGAGSCTLVLSGSDTWEDGTTAAKYVYQENGTIVSVGSGIWRFAPGTRQRVKIFAGTSTITTGASAVAITLGFGDPDAQNVIVDIANISLSASSSVNYGFTQGGSAATLVGNAGLGSLTGSTTTGPHSGSLIVRNVRSTVANGVSTQATGISGTTVNTAAVHVSSSGSISAVNLSPISGTFTGGASGGTYTVWVERP